jgi:Flp pilus assembly protein TadD
VQGVALGLSEKYLEAIAELSRAVEEDPDQAAAHTSLGVAFHRLGEDDRALACYETALKIDPIHAEAHHFRANILYNHGNVREAIAYTIAVGLQPELIEPAEARSSGQAHGL